MEELFSGGAQLPPPRGSGQVPNPAEASELPVALEPFVFQGGNGRIFPPTSFVAIQACTSGPQLAAELPFSLNDKKTELSAKSSPAQPAGSYKRWDLVSPSVN